MADRVTVIPASNEALQAVTTPYVVFEHPFRDRPARLERQADGLDLAGSSCAYALGDVWPVSLQRPYTRRLVSTFLRTFGTFHTSIRVHIWPEGMMYRTSMLQRCQLNELASYRPQASAWCQLKYLLGPALSVRTLVMLEAMIEVPDRLKYDHDFSGERLTTDASSEDLSVIAILDSPKCDVEQILEDINDQRNVSLGDVIVAKRDGSNESIKDARIIGYTGTAAQGANAAIQLARGQRIAF